MMNGTPSRASKGAFPKMTAGVMRGLLSVTLALAILMGPGAGALSEGTPSTAARGVGSPEGIAHPPHFADFGTERASPDALHIANWVADSGDSGHSDFVVVDKKYARVYVFDADARLRGSAPVLIGAARGDDSVAGIGSRPIAEVRPDERTTPAGRFVAERGHNALGEDVIWVDYDAAVSMHRVRTTNPAERRLERLATSSIDDKRISYGCINVPVAFYEGYIRPIFAVRAAVVYVLPEVKSVQYVFGSYDVAAAHGYTH